jgi:hypothetical protein
MPITQAIPIGKHISVPIRMPDGSVYGMFCCLGFAADRSLREHDLQMLKAFADLAASEIARDLAAGKAAKEKEYRIQKVIDDKEIPTLYQPIWRLENPRPLGSECLSRFSAAPDHAPQGWFAEAAEVGLGAPLELAAAECGLAVLDRLPPDIYLAVNLSPPPWEQWYLMLLHGAKLPGATAKRPNVAATMRLVAHAQQNIPGSSSTQPFLRCEPSSSTKSAWGSAARSTTGATSTVGRSRPLGEARRAWVGLYGPQRWDNEVEEWGDGGL